jgi:DNA helicase-2/ATP-dependent DNA helicase PcrA
MTIERFTQKQFEAVLYTPWLHNGLQQGEHEYIVTLNANVNLIVRSSIDASGISASAGEDSIRMWLTVLTGNGAYQPMKRNSELTAYTTRMPGWDIRMNTKIADLHKMADRIKRPIPVCEDCGQAYWLGVTKKAGANQGRIYANCKVHGGFQWMDQENVTKEKRVEQEAQDLMEVLFSNEEPQENKPVFQQKERTLNEQQLAIVYAPLDAPIRVLAGPGSGKTTVLEKRIRHLVTQGAKPGSILYVTFTKTMANEGKNRILDGLRDIVDSDDLDTYGQWFCTIHAACLRIIKADGMQQKEIAKDWQVRKALEEISLQLWPEGERLNDFEDFRRPPVEEILAAISHAKAAGLTSMQDEHYFTDHHGVYHGPKLHQARHRLDKALQGQNLMTFADMLYECELLLRTNAKARQRWQEKFDFVLVDEGQDTNLQAMRILTMLAEPNNWFTIVGDTDQTLMRFMGGEPENNLFDGFTERYPNGLLYFMETNYRSTDAIVQAANQLIAHNYEGKGGPYSDAYYKVLRVRVDAPEGQAVHFLEYDDLKDEAEGVARSIAGQLARNYKPNQFFVASRTRAQLAHLETALMREKVPYINIKGGSFWLAKHVKDCVDYLRLAYDETNEEAFKQVYNIASADMIFTRGPQEGQYCNHRWLGAAFLGACQNKFKNVQSAARTYSYRAGATDLTNFVYEIQGCLQQAGMQEALRCIIDRCLSPWILSREGELAQGDESEGGKLTDLEMVVDIANRCKDVPEFLKFVDDAIETSQKAKDKDWDAYVILSTIHGLKGLERDVVYGTGFSESADSEEKPIGLLPHTYSLVTPTKTGVLNFTSAGLLTDERCCGFVCVSRARYELYLSSVRNFRDYTMKPSRFIYEMGILQEEFV